MPTRSHWQDGHQYHRQFHLVAFTDRCSRATDHYSPVPRPTSGVRSCADPPPAGHCLTPTAELRKIEWARSGRADPLSYYAPNQAIPAEKSIRYSLLAAVGPFTFSHGRRRATPVAPSVPAGWPYGAIPVLCLLSLISRNSPNQLGMVSPELQDRTGSDRYGVLGTPSKSLIVKLDIMK